MVSLAEHDEAEVVVRRLVRSLGGMWDTAVGYVGAYGNVELWRVDVAVVIPRPALLVDGLQWRPTAHIQQRDCWRRAHFDALRLFRVLPIFDEGQGTAGIASLSALTASSPSTSSLPELLVEQQHDPFLQ